MNASFRWVMIFTKTCVKTQIVVKREKLMHFIKTKYLFFLKKKMKSGKLLYFSDVLDLIWRSVVCMCLCSDVTCAVLLLFCLTVFIQAAHFYFCFQMKFETGYYSWPKKQEYTKDFCFVCFVFMTIKQIFPPNILKFCNASRCFNFEFYL